MGLSIVSGPATDPVSLAEAKLHCHIDSTAEDGLIAGYILAARQLAEVRTRRAFVTQTWDYTVNRGWPYQCREGYWGYRLELPLPPLQSVTSVSYIDANGATQTLASNQYTVKSDETFGYIVPAYGVSWPAVREVESAITVRFVAGYTSVPDPIRQAILLLVGHWYENRETVNIGNITSELPFTVDALLDPYRVVRVL